MFNPAFHAAILNKPLIDWLNTGIALTSDGVLKIGQIRRSVSC